MPGWRELETAFRSAMLAGDDGPVTAEIAEDGLPASARLRFYRHHVFSTLTETLGAAYPVVVRLVGEGFFAFAAHRFIETHPPAGPCLFEYGAALPAFLAAFPPCRDLAYLPDVARLEWALVAARHADDAAPLPPAALRDVDPARAARLTFRLDPSLSLLASPWPVDRIWRANQPEGDPAAVVDLAAGGVWLEVRRIADEPGFRGLDPGTYAFRRALHDGRPLGEAAETAVGLDPTFDLTLALHVLIGDGALVMAADADDPKEEDRWHRR
jgi:Putative DNA-binding domain